MALIQWDSALAVGNAAIDSQHKRLVELLNGLHKAMSEGKAKDIMGKLLGDLIDYTVYHFTTEERLMETYSYPDRTNHAKEHRDLKATVVKLRADFAAGNTMITIEVMQFLHDWLFHHIKGSDKELGKFLVSKNAI